MPSVQDAFWYIVQGNPLSSSVSYYGKSAAGAVGNLMGATNSKPANMVDPPDPLWKLAAARGPFIKIAAISGAAALMLSAYGFHKQSYEEKEIELRRAFDTASKYHFTHTLALLGVPLCRHQLLSAILMISGMVMFCGTCYYYAFTGNRKYNKLTPTGGMCLILAWLSMCL